MKNYTVKKGEQQIGNFKGKTFIQGRWFEIYDRNKFVHRLLGTDQMSDKDVIQSMHINIYNEKEFYQSDSDIDSIHRRLY